MEPINFKKIESSLAKEYGVPFCVTFDFDAIGEEILLAVSKALMVSADILKGKGKSNRSNSDTRKIAIFCLREYCHFSYKKIGRIMNRRHTAMMYAYRTYKNLEFTRDKNFLLKISKAQTSLLKYKYLHDAIENNL